MDTHVRTGTIIDTVVDLRVKSSQKCLISNVTQLFYTVLFSIHLNIPNIASRDFITFYFILCLMLSLYM